MARPTARAWGFTGETRSDIIQAFIEVSANLVHKRKDEALLRDLIAAANRLSIEVRTERLFREVGYHAHSGRCRLKGKEMIIVDRDSPVRDQVAFLAAELSKRGVSARQPSTRIGRVQKE